MLPRELFEESDAIMCIFVHFEGHKIAPWWLYLMNVANHVDCFRRPMLDDQAKRLGRVERRSLCAGREGVCMKAIFF